MWYSVNNGIDWSELRTLPKSFTWSASLPLSSNSLLVIGGQDTVGSEAVFDKTHTITINKNQMPVQNMQITNNQISSFPPRLVLTHGSVVHNNKLYIFGGRSSVSDVEYSSDIYISSDSSFSSFSLFFTASINFQRECMKLLSIPEFDSILIFGGNKLIGDINENIQPSPNDLYKFDINTKQFIQLQSPIQ